MFKFRKILSNNQINKPVDIYSEYKKCKIRIDKIFIKLLIKLQQEECEHQEMVEATFKLLEYYLLSDQHNIIYTNIITDDDIRSFLFAISISCFILISKYCNDHSIFVKDITNIIPSLVKERKTIISLELRILLTINYNIKQFF